MLLNPIATPVRNVRCAQPLRFSTFFFLFLNVWRLVMQASLKSGLTIAAAAAALFATAGIATTAQAADDGAVHCTGINSCKGTADCKTAKNDCKGQNSCKGQGWVSKASAAECTKAGGKVAK